MPELRITIPILKVIQALLAAGPGARVYGLELSEQTGIKSGTLYPVLARLEQANWVDSAWEDADPHDVGRPRRRYYQMSGVGQVAATAVVAEFTGRAHEPPTRSRSRASTGPAWGQA